MTVARILVVEDEDSIATAPEFLILREGLGHDRVASSTEALPRIRTDPALADVKVLLMTARGSAIERRRGLETGADGFIAKPFELKDLRAEVRWLLASA